MSLTVNEPAATRDLTTLARVKAELGLTIENAARDAVLTDLIHDASTAIAAFIGHELAREAVVETLPGTGRSELLLERTPIVAVSAVTYNGSAVDADSYEIDDPDTGILFRDIGWTDTQLYEEWLTRNRRPDRAAPLWAVSYVGGYLLPGDDIVGPISVDAADESFNGSALPLLASGDWIVASGFSNAANNGQFKVLSRTPTKVVVDGALTTEGAATRGLAVRTLPRRYERACLETVKTWWLDRLRNKNVQSERIGDWSATYATDGNSYTGVLPASVAAGLSRRVV